MPSMSRFNSPLLLLLVFVLRVSCLRTEIFSKFRELVHKEQYMRWGRGDFIEERTIKQPVDHFHHPTQKSITFEQRYWVNSNYWRKFDGPVFLYIGGEFDMSGEFIDMGKIYFRFRLFNFSNIEDITPLRVYADFIFECSSQYLSNEFSERVRYRLEQERIKICSHKKLSCLLSRHR